MLAGVPHPRRDLACGVVRGQIAALAVEGIVLGSATIPLHPGVVVLVAILCGRTAVALSHYISSLHVAKPAAGRDPDRARDRFACSPIITAAGRSWRFVQFAIPADRHRDHERAPQRSAVIWADAPA